MGLSRSGPWRRGLTWTQCQVARPARKRAKGRGKLDDGAGMPGAGLTAMSGGQARPDRLALKPYWGKLDVRHFREGDGNVGIIRSPVRAIALPDRRLRCGLKIREVARAVNVARPLEESMRDQCGPATRAALVIADDGQCDTCVAVPWNTLFGLIWMNCSFLASDGMNM